MIHSAYKVDNPDKAKSSVRIGLKAKGLNLYPKHIENEDRHFFIPVMSFFGQKEIDAMLQEGFLFDQRLIHEKYKEVVDLAESAYT